MAREGMGQMTSNHLGTYSTGKIGRLKRAMHAVTRWRPFRLSIRIRKRNG
jgi:hypothetical protein